jgi:hypothetical protein
MLYHVLVGILGTAALLGGWMVVQGLKRRSDPSIPPGEDVLAGGRCDGEHACACAAMIGAAERVPGACAAHREE